VLNESVRLLVQAALILFLEQLTINRYDANGFAQIVTDGIGELPQIAIGTLQFMSLPRYRLDT